MTQVTVTPIPWLIFATQHDKSTQESCALAQLVTTSNDITMFADNADRKTLLDTLNNTACVPLFVFAHGEKDHIVGQNEGIALGVADTYLLRNRKVFVYACHTAIELGKKAATEAKCYYGGYNARVIAESEPQQHLEQIFSFIKTSFYELEHPESIEQFLEDLSVMCDKITTSYLDKYPESLDYIGISTMLRHIWAKLEIHVENQKYTHPCSIEPPLW
ncbi:MAG TPA: hypothetical protein PKH93_04325 [Chitinophagales bacterium]|nr:hypothetical protein [Chitinophagales bacterium]